MLKINLLLAVYVVITTVILALAKNNKKKCSIAIGINVIIFLGAICSLIYYSSNSDWFIVFSDWFPLACLPFLHQQTELLTTSYNQMNYDQTMIHLENKYFPYVIAFHNNNSGSFKVLSEYLHLCYLTFYGFIYAIPMYFYLKGQFVQFYEYVFICLFLLFSCYLSHCVIPVCGPRNLFEKIQDHRSDGYIFKLVHKILERGSTYGTAFPSGHTGIACVALLMTWHLSSSVFYFILPLAIGLIISTVYGRFHYVLDLIVGSLYAIIAFLITERFF